MTHWFSTWKLYSEGNEGMTEPILTACASSETLLEARRRQISSLLPRIDHPFYIVAPAYTRRSAGITVLYLLCHYLNARGENAFMLPTPPPSGNQGARLPTYLRLHEHHEYHGGMNAPILTQDVVDYYDKQRITPIVIYPEIYDNPYKVPFFVRYLLNYEGLLGSSFQEKESFAFAYSRILADSYGIADVLYLPTFDLSFWNRSGETKNRVGTCFYAARLKEHFGFEPKHVPDGSVEIQQWPSMSREQIRDIFWRSEAFYCYEDTALASEAVFCGCPVIFVPNERFSGRGLATEELGVFGTCVFGESGGFLRAKLTIDEAENRMRALFNIVPSHIRELASKMKALAKTCEYRGTINTRVEAHVVYIDVDRMNEGDPKNQESEFQRIINSRSWRVTKPLRALNRLIRM